VRDSDGIQGGLEAQGSFPEDYVAAQATISIATATANTLGAAPSGVSGQLTGHALNSGISYARLPDFLVRFVVHRVSSHTRLCLACVFSSCYAYRSGGK
jgi:hypothetical protein